MIQSDTTRITATATLVWTALLGATAVFGSYAFACVFPFAALATIAALTLDARRGAAVVGSVWLVNQIVGFGFRHYPHTLDTVMWGVAIGLGAAAALFAARAVISPSPRIGAPRAVVALAAAFISYEGVLFLYALYAGGLETFSPAIVSSIAVNDALWFAGLAMLRLALVRVLPTPFGLRTLRVA